MRAYFLLCLLVVGFCCGANAQSGTWVWVNGSDTANDPGHYGVQGVADTNNTPPGLYQAVQWKDKQGKLWIFGGLNCLHEEQGDLWKYDPDNNTWTWVKGTGVSYEPGVYGVKGIPSINNSPGARAWGSAAWTDTAGDLWLLGSCGYDSAGIRGDLNDLWRYHIATSEWTWMAGASIPAQGSVHGGLQQASGSYSPSSRSEMNTAWIDNTDNLWVYGGRDDGANKGYGDMWRYNISTGQWAWMSGSLQSGLAVNYGSFGVESVGGYPGGRSSFAHWIDGNHLYLTGGTDWLRHNYNDVWRYNLTTNYWAWVGGVAGSVDTGQYTHYCTSDYGDMPIGRIEQRSAQLNNCSEVLFIWGGGRQDRSYFNDLWSFDIHLGKWRWVSGYDSISPLGNYGAKGMAAPNNMPRCASGACLWGDNDNKLWLWGGQTSKLDTTNGNPVVLNGMWKYIPDLSCFPADTFSGQLNYTLSASAICRGDSSTVTFIGDSITSITEANTVTWLNSSTAKLSPDSSTTYRVIGLTPCGTYAVQDLTVNVLGNAVALSSAKSEICPGDTAQICAPAGFTNYSWSNGATMSCISANTAGSYLVTVSENGSCSAVSNSFTLSLYPRPQPLIHVYNDTLLGAGGLNYQWLLNDTAVVGATANIYVPRAIGTYSLEVTDSNGCSATSSKSVMVTSVTDEFMDNTITVFPNPTTTGWQLNVNRELIGSTAEVFDAAGRLVFKLIIENLQSSINFNSAAKGVYQLRINHRQYIFVKKLVKL